MIRQQEGNYLMAWKGLCKKKNEKKMQENGKRKNTRNVQRRERENM